MIFVGLATGGRLGVRVTDRLGIQTSRHTILRRIMALPTEPVGQITDLGIADFSFKRGRTFGTLLVEWLSKRYKDAHVRASTILFAAAAPCEIISPLMPNGVLSLLVLGLGLVFGLASAVPQNAAIQRITPNEMRGQVTAIYLFMFIVFGALGSQLIGTITQRVFHSDADLRKTIVLTASILMPLAALVISRGIRPYGREVTRLEALA